MPTNFSALDQNLPRFTGEESTERKVQVLQDYLYQLLEALRYAMNNLDTRNFNQTALSEYAGGLTDPIYKQLTDAQGNITFLQLTAEGLQMQITNNAGDIHNLSITAKELSSQISDANGNISILQQTAQKIQSQVSDNAGNISTLTQTATSLQTQITNANGDISTLKQTAEGISATVASHTGSISSLTQTANEIKTSVSDANRNISSIRQTVNSITLSVSNGDKSSTIGLYRDGILVSSQNIVLQGVVTFADLSGTGTTTINGGNIDTSTLRVSSLYGETVSLRDYNGSEQGTMTITPASSAGAALQLNSYGAMRLNAHTGDIYLGAGGYVTLAGTQGNTCAGDFYPNQGSAYNCGTWGFPWNNVYSKDGTISSSDRAQKFDIDYDMSRYSALFDALRPCSFRRRNGESYRAHTGLIAQDVAAARDAAGLPASELAAYCEWAEVVVPGEVSTPSDSATATSSDRAELNRAQALDAPVARSVGCGLRYEEFIAMLIYEVQELKKKVFSL